MRKPKLRSQTPTTTATTWAPRRGLDLNITVTVATATKFAQEQKRG